MSPAGPKAALTMASRRWWNRCRTVSSSSWRWNTARLCSATTWVCWPSARSKVSRSLGHWIAPFSTSTNVGLAFSGGKDSLAVLKLLEPHWGRLRIYHVDTQDLLPETKEVVAHAGAMTKGKIAGWKSIQTNSIGWQDKFGLASDLVSHDCTDMGQAALHGAAGSMHLVQRMTCCAANLSQPLVRVMADDGITLAIRGTRREDSSWGWLETSTPTGPDTFQDGATTYWLPIHDWSAQVFAYLKREGLPIARYYQGEYRHSGPECSRCTAWLEEGRGSFLRKHHPALAGEYLLRLVRVRSAILPTLQQLDAEIAALTLPIT